MKTTLTLTLFIIFVLDSAYLSAQTNSPVEQYIEHITNERIQRDQAMTDPGRSPLSEAQMQRFNALAYFDIDPAYKLNATLTKDQVQSRVRLSFTDNSTSEVTRYGSVTFSFDNQEYTFEVFIGDGLPEFAENPGQLFMPFKDGTSGRESGDNGRYIAIEAPSEGDVVELDFNRAYLSHNDYHRKNVSLIPSNGNQIPVPLTAGQRKFEDRL